MNRSLEEELRLNTENAERHGLFDTHKLNPQGFAEVEKLKSTMSEALTTVLALMPEGREKAIFKTNIQTAMFHGTKAIAGKQGNFTEIVKY